MTTLNPDTQTTVDSATTAPVLKLDSVSFAYAKNTPKIIDSMSYEFYNGKVYAITGPSGAGKTTLLSLISGLNTPSEGAVLFNDKDLAQLDRYTYRSRDVGVIFQSYNLLPSLTVLENIMLTMDASGKHFDTPKKELALEMLKQVHLPERYANEKILHLSGGEQQRVAIARALSDDPQIIIADEPTGNLDPDTQNDIMKIFLDLAHEQNRCVIIVTHSPQIAQQSDEVCKLQAKHK